MSSKCPCAGGVGLTVRLREGEKSIRAAEEGVTAGSCWRPGDFWITMILILLAVAIPSGVGVGGNLQPVTDMAAPSVSLRALIELL